MKKISLETIIIQKNLLTWFKNNQRNLPWRKAYHPYQVWISEIMLQQTQVKTVLPYFERWMKTLPTIQSVAEAKEDEILKLWEGLGYYSRARNLQKAAKQIIKNHEGKFPSNYDDILALPGVGRYTAGAISSIAFNQNDTLVDGNVIRVFSRLFDYSKNTRLPEAEKWMWKTAEKLLPKGEARNFNQGLMELGALICTPKNPDCESCPLKKECQAYAKKTVSQRPVKGPKKQLKSIEVAVAVIWKKGKIFIQKRPSKGLMGGLWEFPGGKIERGETSSSALEREVKEETGLTLKNIRLLKTVKHAYTSFKVRLHCFQADFQEGRVKRSFATQHKWVKPEELNDYPFPAANVRLIKMVQEGG